MTKQIVIARYSEDISWTENFDNVEIYNKGEVLDNTRHHQTLLNILLIIYQMLNFWTGLILMKN